MADDPNRLAPAIAKALGPEYGRVAYAVEAGWTAGALNIATAISMAENTTGNPAAHFVGPKDDSYGLWQINRKAHPEYPAERLVDPAYNAAIAYKLSRGGDKWSDWSTYNDGKYKANVGRASQLAGTVQQLRTGGPQVIDLAGVAYQRPLTLAEVERLQRLVPKDAASKVHPARLTDKTLKPEDRVAAVAYPFIDMGYARELPTGIPGVDDAIKAGADAVGAVVDATTEVWDLARKALRLLTSGEFWKRAGFVVAGAALVAGAGTLIVRSQAMPNTAAPPPRGK